VILEINCNPATSPIQLSVLPKQVTDVTPHELANQELELSFDENRIVPPVQANRISLAAPVTLHSPTEDEKKETIIQNNYEIINPSKATTRPHEINDIIPPPNVNVAEGFGAREVLVEQNLNVELEMQNQQDKERIKQLEQTIKELESDKTALQKHVVKQRKQMEELNNKIDDLEDYKRHTIDQLHRLTVTMEEMELEMHDLRELVNIDEYKHLRQQLARYKKMSVDQKQKAISNLDKSHDTNEPDEKDITSILRYRTTQIFKYFLEHLRTNDEATDWDIGDEEKNKEIRVKSDFVIDSIIAFLSDGLMKDVPLWVFIETAATKMKQGADQKKNRLKGEEVRCYYAIQAVSKLDHDDMMEILYEFKSKESVDSYKLKQFMLLSLVQKRMKEWFSFITTFDPNVVAEHYSSEALLNQPKQRSLLFYYLGQIDRLSIKLKLNPDVESAFAKLDRKLVQKKAMSPRE
jgi:TolA-binding protein